MNRMLVETLESRLLMSWSAYAKLVNQDDAAAAFSKITGTGQTVAIVDTGVDYTQASLGGGFGKGHKVVAGYDFEDNDSNPMDESGHGTSVAGVIAANPYTVNGVTYQGVAPGANLVALRVGTEDDIPLTNIKKALDWVISKYNTYHISVVNMSLGSGSYTASQVDDTLSADLKKLHSLGIFVVAASGNSNDQDSGPISEDGIAYPAADANVFAVGAVDSTDVITTWSQRGSELDLLAPGVNIVMPKLGGGFTTEDGTSFSSPYVAGTAALMKQEDTSLRAGDIGSILMSSGAANRDGDKETGNTTGLLFSRLNINAALQLVTQRKGKTSTLANGGGSFDTALDSQGVLHAAYYDATHKRLMYATRDVAGNWSAAQVIDHAADVGYQVSIAVDASGKVGIGYWDVTHGDLKYASYNGVSWATRTIDSSGTTGISPSLGFSIDGDAYLAYYRRTSGTLRLAHLSRDANIWTEATIDGSSKANVGADASLDVGEAAIHDGPFTQYDTTVAIAYSDTTNGNLKYARRDVDDSTATWFISTVADANGVSNIDLNLHEGPEALGLQAQIAYLDVKAKTVKYAYRDQTWFVESVAKSGTLGPGIQIWFDADNNPKVTYYSTTTGYLYTASRSTSGKWTTKKQYAATRMFSISLNERTNQASLSFLNRARTQFSTTIIQNATT